jgi:L-ascorbate metabolism protein UlaG (beta-lactamase superfamily)
MKITWLGHATWLIESSEHQILIDPFLTGNPSASCAAKDVTAQTILVSHGHSDHLGDAAEIANRCGAMLVSNFEIATWFAEKHHVKNTLGMNLGGQAKMPWGKVKMTVAWHSSVLPDGTNGGNPGGFVLELDGKRIYYAGDTALFSDMSLIGRGHLDVAILPIGDLFTMGPDDCVEATKYLNPKFVLPTHYNTWPPIAQDANAWAELIRSQTSSTPVVLKPGQSHTI